jgi:small-conductance mechanosensitive channel
MDNLIDPNTLATFWESVRDWVTAHVLTISTFVQLLAVGAAFVAALCLAGFVRRGLGRVVEREIFRGRARSAMSPLAPLVLFLVWLAIQWLMIIVAVEAAWPSDLMRITASLLTAWVVIRLAANILRDKAWSRFVAVVAWPIAALNILGLLDDTIAVLDSLAFNLGDLRLSVLVVIKGVLALGVLLWLAMVAGRVLERRISASPNLTPSVQVLIAKLLKATFVVIAILAAIGTVGIDLSAFAFFGGALGLGIGFGLQKVISNLISGVILLLDKSLKPGDVIAVDGTYGWIRSLGARYALVVTRDGIEHLIPNEELITTRVENWSHSDQKVRLKIPVGVSYDTDLHKAMALCIEAASAVDRVIDEPPPRCLLIGFGDSSVDLQIRLWIGDADKGIRNVSSDVLLNVWDRFRENGIEIPFPQRDVHIRSADGLDGRLGAAA